jgi:hypothetical protein
MYMDKHFHLLIMVIQAMQLVLCLEITQEFTNHQNKIKINIPNFKNMIF